MPLTTVYLASNSPDKFNFLRQRFGSSIVITDDASQADLLIVDLADPVRPTWATGGMVFFVLTPCPPPFLLTTLGGEPDSRTYDVIKEIFPVIPPVQETTDQLEDTLAWIQSMFPLYNVKNVQPSADSNDRSKSFVLGAMKLQ